MWKSIRHEARDGYHANVRAKKPRRIIECSIDNCTDSSAFSWNRACMELTKLSRFYTNNIVHTCYLIIHSLSDALSTCIINMYGNYTGAMYMYCMRIKLYKSKHLYKFDRSTVSGSNYSKTKCKVHEYYYTVRQLLEC